MQIKPKLNKVNYSTEESGVNQVQEVDEAIEEIEVVVDDITPKISSIVSTLMAAKTNFHVLHFQTTSHSAHLALEDLYKGITKLSDNIIESLLGRFNTRIQTGLVINCNPLSSDDTQSNILEHISLFSTFVSELAEWSNDNKYYDINNLASELDQLINITNYKLSMC